MKLCLEGRASGNGRSYPGAGLRARGGRCESRGHRAWRKHDVQGNQAINLPVPFCYQFPGEAAPSRGWGVKGPGSGLWQTDADEWRWRSSRELPAVQGSDA